MEELVSALRRRTALSVSIGAGGVRSLAGLGVLRGFRVLGPTISRYTGASFGALIAACLAFGLPEAILLSSVSALRVRHLLRPTWRGHGVLSNEPMRRFIDAILPDARIEDAPIPLTVWCTDLALGEAVEFSSGPVREIILASSVFAGLFNAVHIDGRVFTDGGYAAAVPMPCVGDEEHALIVDVRRPPTLTVDKQRSLLNPFRWVDAAHMVNASIDTLFASQRTPERAPNFTVIRPPLGDMLVTDFRHAQEAVMIGERLAQAALRQAP